MSRRHPDVDYEVSGARGGQTFTEETFDAAASRAIQLAMGRGEATLDVIVHSRSGASFVGGDEGVAQYDEDPEASVFERLQIRVNSQGRVP